MYACMLSVYACMLGVYLCWGGVAGSLLGRVLL